MSIDPIADMAVRSRTIVEEASGVCCDACDEVIEGEPAGSGLFMWTRGEEVRFEEPPLCMRCATAIGVTALSVWSAEEEEG